MVKDPQETLVERLAEIVVRQARIIEDLKITVDRSLAIHHHTNAILERLTPPVSVDAPQATTLASAISRHADMMKDMMSRGEAARRRLDATAAERREQVVKIRKGEEPM